MGCIGITVLPSVNLHSKMLFTPLGKNVVLYELLHHNQNELGQALPSAATVKYKT